MDIEQSIQQVAFMLRERWKAHAYTDGFKDGRLFYFVFTSNLQDRVVLPAWGEDCADARRRLESSLRLLGVGRIMEFEAGEIEGRLSMPVCRCGALMEPAGTLLWGWIAAWRCGTHACWRRMYTLCFERRPPEPVCLFGGNDQFDIDR